MACAFPLGRGGAALLSSSPLACSGPLTTGPETVQDKECGKERALPGLRDIPRPHRPHLCSQDKRFEQCLPRAEAAAVPATLLLCLQDEGQEAASPTSSLTLKHWPNLGVFFLRPNTVPSPNAPPAGAQPLVLSQAVHGNESHCGHRRSPAHTTAGFRAARTQGPGAPAGLEEGTGAGTAGASGQTRREPQEPNGLPPHPPADCTQCIQ